MNNSITLADKVISYSSRFNVSLRESLDRFNQFRGENIALTDNSCLDLAKHTPYSYAELRDTFPDIDMRATINIELEGYTRNDINKLAKAVDKEKGNSYNIIIKNNSRMHFLIGCIIGVVILGFIVSII